MQSFHITSESGFRVLASTARSQAATMVLPPNGATGGPNNRHPHSDQWLYVIAGHGTATVNKQQIALEAGMLLLIEANEPHAIANSGSQPLVTINIYAPPEY
jgi:mannose-6-phosphate isomerase-like protein (cupin superfamily)